jgi:hypothetical protein
MGCNLDGYKFKHLFIRYGMILIILNQVLIHPGCVHPNGLFLFGDEIRQHTDRAFVT